MYFGSMRRVAPIGFILCLAAPCCISAAPLAPQSAAIPGTLSAPSNQALALEAHASGAQIYECQISKDEPTRLDWVFKAPEAYLTDAAGKRIGKHFAGPTWESTDGSRVVGEVKAKDDGPDAGAIPWLLLAAKSTAGNGVFSATQSIQRLQTVGGKAPATHCTQAQLGTELRVPYTATYRFFNAVSK